MPCHLCGTRSEDYPKPARFVTPLMQTTFPDFKEGRDFLCPKCYTVYFSVMESSYSQASRRSRNYQSSLVTFRGFQPSTSRSDASTSTRWATVQPDTATSNDSEPEKNTASKRKRDTP